ncbi:hypothetical protein AgCh_013912 [Apium graveolens]
MAQLPPKFPNVTPNWLDLSSRSHHQKLPSMENLDTMQSRSWVDHFPSLSSSSKRGPHRRTGHAAAAAAAADEFDKFDEEQFMAMFTDDEAVDLTVACSVPSSPPDHNGMDDGLIRQCTTTSTDEQMQLESGFKSHSALEGQNVAGDGVASIDNYNDKNFDPRRVKRIMANRQSAQRSRVRKLQYISELEHGVNSLQAEISVLSPRVAFLDHQRLVLNVDNSVLRQRIAALPRQDFQRW